MPQGAVRNVSPSARAASSCRAVRLDAQRRIANHPGRRPRGASASLAPARAAAPARRTALSAAKVSMTRSASQSSDSCSSGSDWPKRCMAAPSPSRMTFLNGATACASASSGSALEPSLPDGVGAHERIEHLARGRDKREVPFHGALHEQPGDQQPIDLVRPFEDSIDARVAIMALGGVVADVTVAAVNLHVLIEHVLERLAAGHLRDRRLDGELLQHRRQARRPDYRRARSSIKPATR